MSRWNQPTCDECWQEQRPDQPVPVRIRKEYRLNPELCSYCGYPTYSGIWQRADPATVPFPQKEEVEA